ncbi:MAG TPA: DUF554 domain-containing protein [Candidatus Limnocylindria bacterium]|nr:DUF554 domain-containing protein [Candidatus Limnocylindria bacterium]
MIGTMLNVAGIVMGGLAGLTLARFLTPQVQQRLRLGLAGLVVYVGFSMVWEGLHGPLGHAAKQLVIALISLSLGSLTGWFLRLQRGMNRFGVWTRERFQKDVSAAPGTVSASDGFITCTLLFCVGPLAILGSIQDGIDHQWRPLALKGLMDGLATMGFVATYGWSPLLAALPVLAYQGALTLGAQALEPLLRDAALKDSLNVAGGFIVTTIAVVVLGARKVPLANYLPALLYAPLLTHWWG